MAISLEGSPLPNTISYQIIGYLDLSTEEKMCLVSKAWKQHIKSYRKETLEKCNFNVLLLPTQPLRFLAATFLAKPTGPSVIEYSKETSFNLLFEIRSKIVKTTLLMNSIFPELELNKNQDLYFQFHIFKTEHAFNEDILERLYKHLKEAIANNQIETAEILFILGAPCTIDLIQLAFSKDPETLALVISYNKRGEYPYHLLSVAVREGDYQKVKTILNGYNWTFLFHSQMAFISHHKDDVQKAYATAKKNSFLLALPMLEEAVVALNQEDNLWAEVHSKVITRLQGNSIFDFSGSDSESGRNEESSSDEGSLF